MNEKVLHETALAMVAKGKGILAADESTGTIKKRFDKIGVENTEANRQAYRDMLFTTPGFEQHTSGVILFEETLFQKSLAGPTFAELLTKGKIRFATKRAEIDPDSAGILDRLIETALRCPTANIEVVGHTDADGEDSFNQDLSEKRAQAVIDYLVKAGLPPSRFTAVGQGSTQPVAGNDTDEGKAQNRRIEFLVR